jgi:glycosyltransferase involved in cell wall biosynthesis
VRRLLAEERVDLIDAHYAYPDGVAAAWLGRRLGLPVVLTCRGSDVTLLPKYRRPRRLVLEAINGIDGLVTVSQGLKDALIALGVDADRITVLRNGVDLNTFSPMDRAVARAALEVERPMILSVGNLIPLKGVDLTIRALARLPGVTLVLVGEGPERPGLEALARATGVADRVRFAGRVEHERLRVYFSAADVSVLASMTEGWANVLLESMACGTPVVATDIPGTREVVIRPEAGLLVPRSTEAIADGIRRLLADRPPRAATRTYAEGFSWGETTQGQLALFERILERRRARRTLTPAA